MKQEDSFLVKIAKKIEAKDPQILDIAFGFFLGAVVLPAVLKILEVIFL